MRTFLKIALISGAVAMTGIASAKSADMPAPAGTPAGATAQCNDGSYYNGATRSGACRGHKGLKAWFAVAPAAAPATPAAPAAPAHPMPAMPAGKPMSMPASHKADMPMAAPAAPMPMPAAGNGQVWVNTDSKVYHCPGSRYYGKTKQGQYMSEAAAQAAGDRPDHGKACK